MSLISKEQLSTSDPSNDNSPNLPIFNFYSSRNNNTFLFWSKILAVKFFCIKESSIWVPKDLGSIATLTPVPKMPEDDTPAHPLKIKPKKSKMSILFFIFNFQTIIIDNFF